MINWYFEKDFFGYVECKDNKGNDYLVNLYSGNCLAIFVYEDKDTYTLNNFFCDKKHLMNCIDYNFKVYKDTYKVFHINSLHKGGMKFLKELIKYNFTICINDNTIERKFN